MPETNLHSSRRHIIRQLLAENDGVLQITSALLAQPAPMRAFLDIILADESWNAMGITDTSVAGAGGPFNIVAVAGTLGRLPVSLVASGDSTDMEAAAKPSATVGSLFIGGDVTVDMERLLDRMLFAGFRLRREVRQLTRWHDYQVGRQPSPEVETVKLPTRDHGYLNLLLGQDCDRAMQVQIAWGNGQSRLFLPGKQSKD